MNNVDKFIHARYTGTLLYRREVGMMHAYGAVPRLDEAAEAVGEVMPFAARFAERVEDVVLPADRKVSPIYGDRTCIEVTGGKIETATDDY